MAVARSSSPGAGGSIGSELARQVFDLDPARLVLLDRAEGAALRHRTRARAAGRPRLRDARSRRHARAELVARLANVASLDAMDGVLGEDRPVLVLHAAAYKHVPMMEHHPADAVYTNVGGTLAALRASPSCGRRAVRPGLHRQGGRADLGHGRDQAARRAGGRRRRGSVRPALRGGPVRQRARLIGQRRAALPAPAARGRAADDHRPGDDPLLHDHPGGVPAHPRGVAARASRATCSCSTWASRSGSSTSRATSPGWPGATRIRSRSSTSACGRARSSTRRSSTTPRRSSRPSTRRSVAWTSDGLDRRRDRCLGELDDLVAVGAIGRP